MFFVNWLARVIAALIPIESAPPCDFTIVPFNPRNTPPFTRRGSILFLRFLRDLKAIKEAILASNDLLKVSLKSALTKVAVPSPVFKAIFPVKPSVTITSIFDDGISSPST